MRRFFLAAALSIAAISVHAEALTADSIKSMNSKQIEANLPDSHPSAYFLYAIKLFKDGKQDLGVRYYYIGQIRYRAHLLANPDLPANADPAEFADINKNIGPGVSDWAGGNIRIWVQSITEALAWDASQPNNFTPKEANAAPLQQARDEVTKTRDNIKKSEAQIRSERASRGLTDR